LQLYRCSHEGCGYACPSKNGMSLHVLKHSQPDAFACEICGKTFKRLAYVDHTALTRNICHCHAGCVFVTILSVCLWMGLLKSCGWNLVTFLGEVNLGTRHNEILEVICIQEFLYLLFVIFFMK